MKLVIMAIKKLLNRLVIRFFPQPKKFSLSHIGHKKKTAVIATEKFKIRIMIFSTCIQAAV